MSQMAAFNALAQQGQELSRENLWPAEITLQGTVGAIACSGGNLRETGVQLVAGGKITDCDLAFRVRKVLVMVKPEPGSTHLGYLSKRWLVMRVIDDPRDDCYLIGADSKSK